MARVVAMVMFTYTSLFVVFGILVAFGWALFVSPVFRMPYLDLPQIIGLLMLLFTVRFFLAPRITNNSVNLPFPLMKGVSNEAREKR